MSKTRAKPVSVFIVDDYEFVRVGVLTMLSRHAEISVVGEASTVTDAISESFRLKPDVVLMAPDGKTERARFHLTRCIPIKLKAPPLNAKDGGVAIEEFQMAYEAMTRKVPTA